MLPRKPALSIQPEDILAGHQPAVQKLAEELRVADPKAGTGSNRESLPALARHRLQPPHGRVFLRHLPTR